MWFILMLCGGRVFDFWFRGSVSVFSVQVSGFRGLCYFTDMCSGSEEGSYVRLIDCVFHSTLGLTVIKKKQRVQGSGFRV